MSSKIMRVLSSLSHRFRARTVPRLVGSCLLLLFLTIPIVHAQDDDDGGPTFTKRELEALSNLPDVPKRQKRKGGELAFAIFSFGKSGEDYFYLRNEKPEQIFFNTGVVRRFQFGGQEGRLVIYKRLVDEEGEYTLAPVGHVSPPSGSRDGIVLFRPHKDDGTKAARKLPFIDLARATFRPNDIRLVNMTSQPLVVKLGDKPVRLPPMKSVVQSQQAGAATYPVKVAMRDKNKKVQVIYSNIFQTEPKKRVMLMIVPDWMNANAGTPVRCMVYKDTGAVSG